MYRVASVALALALISHCRSEVVSPGSIVGQETCNDTCERAGLTRGVLDLLSNGSLEVTVCACNWTVETIEVSQELKIFERRPDAVYIPLMNYDDKQYMASLSVHGENLSGTSFQVLISTLQDFIWLPGMRCNSTHCNKATKVPQYKEGETVKKLFYPGTVSGRFESKQLTLYDKKNNTILIGAHDILLADEADGFKEAEYDGGLGLNYAGSSPSPLVQRILRGYNEKIFHLYLYSISSLFQSWLVLGGGRGGFKFAPLVEPGWAIRATGIGFGLPGPFIRGNHRVLLEAAYPYISGPSELVRRFHKVIEGQKGESGQYIVQCNRAPVIKIKVPSETGSDITLLLEPKDYLVRRKDSKGLCDSLVIESEEKTESWILGSPFFRAYYVAFDFTEERMGIGFRQKRKK